MWVECCKVQLYFINTHLKAPYSIRAVERHYCENKNLVQVLNSLNSYLHYGQFAPLCQYKKTANSLYPLFKASFQEESGIKAISVNENQAQHLYV